MADKLKREDYLKNPFFIAKHILLGSYLCTNIDGKLTKGKITEVELYIGGKDKASHSYEYKRTARTEIQYHIGGHAYIFKIYGMYDQFCVVTNDVNIPNVALIRSLEPIEGIDIMKERRKTNNIRNLTTGPGKLCQALGIKTDEHYGIDLLGDVIWISPKLEEIKISDIIATPRIGIDYAQEYAKKCWRFVLKNNKYLSR